MVPIEIERKFTIKYLPKEIESIKKITQKHIFKDSSCSIRVRRSFDVKTKERTYTHTIKAKGKNVQKYAMCELENFITEEEYDRVHPFQGSKIIEKYRCVVPIENNLKAEVDIYEGWMKGLIIAEVEFENEEQAENFKMPRWFEKAVSHQEFSNRTLSTKNRYEIINMIDKSQLIKNNNIYYEFKNRLTKHNNKQYNSYVGY